MTETGMPTPASERAIILPTPHPLQLDAIKKSKRYNVMECGRRFGKTTMGVSIAVNMASKGALVGWFAPTYKYLYVAWEEVKRLGVGRIRMDANNMQAHFPSGGRIDFWSLFNNSDAGRSFKYHECIFDEAGKIVDFQNIWEQSVRATLTDYKGGAWFNGTPKGSNYFHQLFLKADADPDNWTSHRYRTVDNPYIDPLEVEAARKELPEQVFAQEYLGIPAADGGNPFGCDSIAACLGGIVPGMAKYIGVDLAKSRDWTVCHGLDAVGRTCLLERWQGTWATTEEKLAALFHKHKGAFITMDSTGVGDPIVEGLQRKFHNIVGFKFSQGSKQQLMEGLASALHTRKIVIPDGVTRRELDIFEYEYTRTGVRYSAPAGMHDDCVCALALAVNGMHEHSNGKRGSFRVLDPADYAPKPTEPARKHQAAFGQRGWN